MFLSRRALVMMAGGAIASTPGAGVALARPANFNPEDPKDNLNGLVKVMGDNSGKPAWMVGSGRIYALPNAAMPVPLFGVEGIRYIKFTPDGDQFRMHVRDWGYFTDLNTGLLLESYENPYTGKTNTPAPLLTPYFSWTMGPKGQHIDGFTGKAWLIDKPLKMPWRFSGQDASLTLELLVEYGNGGSGGEWINMLTDTDELLSPSVNSARMRYGWTGYSPWARWMDMEDLEGRTLWNSNGGKVANLNGLDPKVRSTFDRLFPGSLDSPETYEKTSGLTTTGED